MQGTREQFDADRIESRSAISTIPKGPNQYKLLCSMCSETLYVDKQLYDNTLHSIEEGLDNPFLCDDCQLDYDELAHSDH
jgi:hypothetical protein